MKIVLASQNRHKLRELRDILAGEGAQLLLASEAGFDAEVEETGETFEENARIKAEAVRDATGLPALADDSGLMVEALGGAPGVYSARYGGEGLDDVGRYRLLLSSMAGQVNRRCKFVSCICLALPDGSVVTARGECAGTLAYAPRGENGFGYDPIFFLPTLKKTFAELTPEEKNQVSHRAAALRAFQQQFTNQV